MPAESSRSAAARLYSLRRARGGAHRRWHDASRRLATHGSHLRQRTCMPEAAFHKVGLRSYAKLDASARPHCHRLKTPFAAAAPTAHSKCPWPARLRVARRLRRAGRRVRCQIEELAYVGTAVAVDVVIVRARRGALPVAIVAGDVAVVVLQRTRSLRASGQGLDCTLGIEKVVDVAYAMIPSELLLEQRERADELRRRHRCADRVEEAAAQADPIGGQHGTVVRTAAQSVAPCSAEAQAADLHADVGHRAPAR